MTRPFALAGLLTLGLCLLGGQLGPIGDTGFTLGSPWSSAPWTFPAGGFVLLYLATGISALFVLLSHPRHWSFPREAVWIFLLALLCRMALLPHEPSDDVNRYLWEGRILNAGRNPYAHAPDDPALAGLAAGDPYHDAINHPTMPAAYPPLVLILFSALTRISYTPEAVKAVMVAFDLATLMAVLALLARRGLPARWAYAYALNPIILYAFAGQAHFDALSVFFLTATLVAYDRKRWALVWLLAGLAVQAKYVALLAVPFLWRRDNLKQSPFFFLTALLPAMPFLWLNAHALFDCLLRFGRDFAFNGPLHQILLWAGLPLQSASLLCGILLLLTLGLGYARLHPAWNPKHRDDPVAGCFLALGALVVFSPTVHVWYLAWLVPWLAIRPSAPWLILSLTSGFYFVVFGVLHQTGIWRLPTTAYLLEWVPFLLLLVREGRRAWCRAEGKAAAPPHTLTVIVPTRNEAACLGPCLAALASDPAVSEVIVADAGSTDRTRQVAETQGAKVVLHDAAPDQGGGRGGQIHAALLQARGDVIAIVHADTRVRHPDIANIMTLLRRQPLVVGGSLGGGFDQTSLRFTILALANDFRAAVLGLPFGDQVQFFRRAPVLEARAYPAIPLMEDVELGLRLARLGRTVHLFGNAVVSSRRWQQHALMRAFLIVRLVSRYLVLRLHGTPETASFFHRYYG